VRNSQIRPGADQKLEDQLEAITQELKKVKEEAAANKQRRPLRLRRHKPSKEVDQLKGEIADVKRSRRPRRTPRRSRAEYAPTWGPA
jgi:hypothetical protein